MPPPPTLRPAKPSAGAGPTSNDADDAPPWAGPPPSGCSLEVFKGGQIVESLPLTKAATMLGRCVSLPLARDSPTLLSPCLARRCVLGLSTGTSAQMLLSLRLLSQTGAGVLGVLYLLSLALPARGLWDTSWRLCPPQYCHHHRHGCVTCQSCFAGQCLCRQQNDAATIQGMAPLRQAVDSRDLAAGLQTASRPLLQERERRCGAGAPLNLTAACRHLLAQQPGALDGAGHGLSTWEHS